MSTNQAHCPICFAKTPSISSIIISERDLAQCDSCTHIWDLKAKKNQGFGASSLENLEKNYLQSERDKHLVEELISHGLIWEGIRILDYGAGPGFLSGALRNEFGFDIDLDCYEPSPVFIQYLIDKKFRCVTDLSKNEYDFIIMKEVIEHIDDPIESISRLRGCLNRDYGKIFLSTPAGDWSRKRGTTAANRDHWATFRDKSHIHFFTEESLTLLMNKLGFRRLDYVYFDNFYPKNIGQPGAKKRYLDAYRANRNGKSPHLTYIVS